MPIIINPYIAGNPVGGTKSFFGRQDVFKRILSLLQNPNENALTLYGQRRIGKTSILKELERQLQEPNSYCPVYFDLQDKAAWTLHEVLYDLARTISLKLDLEAPSKEQFQNETYDYYGQEFLASVLHSLGENRAIVLLFDEFDVLDNPNLNRAGVTFFPYLRELMGKHLSSQKFIFVIGRKPEDLSNITLSVFKGVPSQRVSMLQREDAESIIRISEREGNQTLLWDDKAVERVWQLTHGHPYMTQLLCRVTWERIYDDSYEKIPTALADHVDASVESALREGTNAYTWIWQGLPPAERLVIAALSEGEDKSVSKDEINNILQQRGVRIVISELLSAPETLVSWDLLEKVDTDYFQFRVPLFRLWAQQNKPLIVVKEEIDRLNPQAETLFQAAKRYFDDNNLSEALNMLNRVLLSNPNHVKAKLLQGQVWLEEKNINEAVRVLRDAYDYDPLASRPLLTQALLVQAETAHDDDALNILSEILEIDPYQQAARKLRLAILNRTAEVYLTKGQFDLAIKAYQQAGNQDGLQQVLVASQKARLIEKEQLAKSYVSNELWLDAARVYQELLADFPDESTWQAALENVNQQSELQQLYLQAVGALESGDIQQADELLTRIVRIRKDYRDTPRLLLLITKGVDIEEMVKPPVGITRATFWRGLIALGVLASMLLIFLAGMLIRSAAEQETLNSTLTQVAFAVESTTTQQAEQQATFLADITQAAINTITQQAMFLAGANETNAPTLTQVAIVNTQNAALNQTLVALTMIAPTPSMTLSATDIATFTLTPPPLTDTATFTSTPSYTPSPTNRATFALTLSETPTPINTVGVSATSRPTATTDPSPVFVVNTNVANLREGPGTNYAIVGTAAKGQQLVITGRNNNSSWYRVGSSQSWISATIGLVQGSNSSIPVVSSNAPTITSTAATVVQATSTPTNNDPFIINAIQQGSTCSGYQWLISWSDPNGDVDRIEFRKRGTGGQGSASFDVTITGNRTQGTTAVDVSCSAEQCTSDVQVVDRAGNRSNIWVTESTCTP